MLRFTSIMCVLVITGCSDTCTNEKLARASSPDGRHVAVMFERNCGTTTGFSTQISVLRTGRTASGSGNVFVADSDHGAVHQGGWSGALADAVWLSPDHLLIRYAASSRIFKQTDRINGINVSYEPVDP